MNAVETIQAAIVRLEELRDKSTPEPWVAKRGTYGSEVGEYEGAYIPGVADEIDATPDNGFQPVFYPAADADLIVTLHRTIDAQMAILRHVLDHANQWDDEEFAEVYIEELALANAILGGAE